MQRHEQKGRMDQILHLQEAGDEMTTEEKQELTLTEEQVAELAWRRNLYDNRYVWGMINKDTGGFTAYAHHTKSVMLNAIKDGHTVFLR